MDQLVTLLCVLDPDVACLQELWDADASEVIALKAYVSIARSVKGPRKGMWILLHRRLQLGSPPK